MPSTAADWKVPLNSIGGHLTVDSGTLERPAFHSRRLGTPLVFDAGVLLGELSRRTGRSELA